jgi:hypothetical protein
MAVIIREDRIIAGKNVQGVKVYKSDRLLTRELREQAEKLDQFLAERMKEIEEEIKKKGLLKLKNRRGVIKLWYEVGRHLSFVMDTSLVPAEDRKYVWRALYDHAGNLVPRKLSVRARERPENSHFRYCYELAQFPWQLVKASGNWTAWVEFLDSPVIRDDRRIIKWLAKKQKFAESPKQDWLRMLTREIRRTFKKFRKWDTSILSDEELDARLEKIFNNVFAV